MSHPVELKFSSKVCFFEAGLHEARWSFEKLGTWSLCPRRCRELHSSAAAGAESTASVRRRPGARPPIARMPWWANCRAGPTGIATSIVPAIRDSLLR